MDDEVSISGTGRGCRSTVPGVAAGDRAEQGDGDLRGLDQPGSRAHADRDTAADIGIEGGAVSEGEELTQAADGVSDVAEAILGPASVGARLLGGNERERDG